MFNEGSEDKQREFFNDLSETAKKSKQRRFHFGKLALSLSYENTCIIIIGLIMILIVCYSLGVERGKQLAMLKVESIKKENIEVEQNPLPEKQVQEKPEIRPTKPVEKKQRVKLATASSSKRSPYIQVATFSKDKYAKAEIERLKDKGYQPFLIARGRFSEVCVGGYKDKQEALAALKQLKNIYADCLLRQK